MVFFALASFQNLSILSLSSVALKPVHVFSLLFLPLLLMNKEVRINKAVAVFHYLFWPCRFGTMHTLGLMEN